MALKEYELNGVTYLFDSDNVPEGAEEVGDIQPSVAPTTPPGVEGIQTAEDLEPTEPAEKEAPKPQNKARKAANKA